MKKLSLLLLCVGLYNIFPKAPPATIFQQSTLPQHVVDYITDTTTVQLSEKHFKADISFMFIDFKYDKGTIKICEFGRGKTIGLGDTPCTMLINKQLATYFTPYWPLFWHYLGQYAMPVWVVGVKPSDHKSEVLNTTESNDAWRLFENHNGRYQKSLSALERDPLFQQLAAEGKSRYHASKFTTHQGIIIHKPRVGDRWGDYATFRKKYPQFIYLDDVGSINGGFKHVGASLFEDPVLQAYKPRWKSYPKKYTPTLASEIINDIKSEIMVIKPVASGYGQGIIMVTKEELDATLQFICGHYAALTIPSTTYERVSHTYNHWKHDKNTIFMVEEYCPSTPVYIHNDYYDPTMRFYFVMQHDYGKIAVNIFGGYFKLPVKPLSAEATLTEKHKTVPYYPSPVPLSALTLPEDLFDEITAKLKEILPQIYKKMLETRRTRDEDGVFSKR